MTAPRPMRRPCSRLSSASGGADPRAARPVGDVIGGAGQRAVRIAAGQLARHAREPRPEHERLHAGPGGDAGLQVLEHHPRVRRHRARDVADEHEPPRALGGLAVAALEQLAAVPQRSPDGRPQVVQLAPASGAARAAGEPLRRAAGELDEQRPRQRALGVRVLGEVLLAQQLLLAPRGRHGNLVEHGRRRRLRGNACPRRALRLDQPRRAERAPLFDLPAEDGRERLREEPEIGARRAQRGAQREERVGARGRVDGGERAMRVQQLPYPYRRPAGPHRPCELGEAIGDDLRHRGALRGRGRARCPPAPSAPRRACPRGRPRRRAPAARVPT